jgi:regulatory protein
LANREHSRSELERKLGPHEESPGQLAKVLDELLAKDFINHERVVASVVYRRSAKVGVRRVAQELQQKGIAPAEMQEAMAELKSSEMERARAVWLKKFGVAATTPQEKARQLRFMASRGFGAEVLYKLIDSPDEI